MFPIPNYQIVDFLDWIRNQYPELNLSGDIPFCKLNDLIDEFCKNKNTQKLIR